MKLALAHEYLIKMGGAERVLLDLLEEFNDPAIFTFLLDRDKLAPKLRDKPNIYTSYLNNYPFSKSLYRYFFPLMPEAAESFDLQGFDVVLTLSHQFMKGIITPQKTLHISYIYTPTRFLWLEHKEPFFLKSTFKNLREWDFLAAQRPDVIFAPCQNVAKRIKKYYGRKAKVIYCGIHTENFQIAEPKDYFLLTSRLEPHKKTELALLAFKSLPYKLKIVGEGSEYPKLKKLAQNAKNIEFLGFVPDEELKKLYAQSLALIFPQEEDFGLVPLEAQASGRPVIAYGKGGVLETIKENETGIFFAKPVPGSLVKAVENFKSDYFDPQKIREWAKNFDSSNFKKNMREAVEEELNKFRAR